MRVEEALTLDEYWIDRRFLRKRPNLTGSLKQAFGDNIYHRSGLDAPWQQEDSHHSFHDGSPNPANIHSDTGTNRMLASTRFTYWGGSGPKIPKKFRSWNGIDICATTQGHKVNFPEPLVTTFLRWLSSLRVDGYAGEPFDW
jgi:Nucleotide modification associated domain 2